MLIFPRCLMSFGSPASAPLRCFETDSVKDRLLHSFLIVCDLSWLGISYSQLLICQILNEFIEIDEDSVFVVDLQWSRRFSTPRREILRGRKKAPRKSEKRNPTVTFWVVLRRHRVTRAVYLWKRRNPSSQRKHCSRRCVAFGNSNGMIPDDCVGCWNRISPSDTFLIFFTIFFVCRNWEKEGTTTRCFWMALSRNTIVA